MGSSNSEELDLSGFTSPQAEAITRAVARSLARRSTGEAEEHAGVGRAEFIRRLYYHLTEYRTCMATASSDPLARLTYPCEGAVLDVGCGFGQALLFLGHGRRLDRLVGVDVDREMLRFGGYLDSELHAPDSRLELVAADAMQLPFVDRSFDLVICRVVLMSLPVRRAVTELCRVVREGGRLYLHLTGAGFYLQDLSRGRCKGSLFALMNGTMLTLISRQLQLKGLWNNYQTSSAVSRFVREAGLDVIARESGPTHWGLPLNAKILARRPTSS